MGAPDTGLIQEAVEMLKRGSAEDAVVERLVALGASPDLARDQVARLVQLKRQAQVDPNRLRAEAWGMLERGSPPQFAVDYLVSEGVLAEHARPEVDRLLAELQRRAELVPCERCRGPMHPAQAFFDRFGNRVCRRCNIADEMGAAQQRIVEGELERAGVPAWALQKDKDVKWCPRCNDLTGAVVSVNHRLADHSYAGASRVFGCSRCGEQL